MILRSYPVFLFIHLRPPEAKRGAPAHTVLLVASKSSGVWGMAVMAGTWLGRRQVGSDDEGRQTRGLVWSGSFGTWFLPVPSDRHGEVSVYDR